MGLFRALIVVAVSVFVLSIINDDTKLKAIPLIGSRIDKSVKKQKHIIIVFIIALIELIL